MIKEFLSKYFPFVWFTVMPLISSVMVGYFSLDWFSNQEQNWLFLIILYAGVSFFMSLGMLPTTFVAVFTGFLGGWKLLPFMVLAYVLASFLGFQLGLRTDKTYWLNLLKRMKRGEELLKNSQQKSNLFVFSCRLSPLLPFGISNVVFAILGIPLKRFLVWGTLGMLPRTILSIWLGVQAEDFTSALTEGRELPVFQLTTVALIFLSTLIIIRVFFKRNHI